MCDLLKDDSVSEEAMKAGQGTATGFEQMIQAWDEWAKRVDASLAMLGREHLVAE